MCIPTSAGSVSRTQSSERQPNSVPGLKRGDPEPMNKNSMKGRTVNLITKRYTTGVLTVVSAMCLSSCDPVLNIAGAHFPAWLLCALAGACLTALTRPLFLAVGIEAYLWPRPLVYSSLAVLLACIAYLLFFNRI